MQLETGAVGRYAPAVRYAVGLLIVAILSAAVVAYGVDPHWMRFQHGLQIITASHRLLWPMTGLSIVACLGLFGVMTAGKCRVVWLVGLLPVLAMFSHRFVTGPMRNIRVAEDPPLADASAATFVRDSDYVVGVRFEGSAYALPFASLYRTPMVLLSGRQNRLAVFWSPAANRVLAFSASRELRGRDLEVVSFPANAALIYDGRLGQFINALTGLTPNGTTLTDLRQPLQTVKLTWAAWRAAEPTSKVLLPVDPHWQTAPVQPILPNQALPAHRPELLEPDRVCLLATTPPVALSADLVGTSPCNVSAGTMPVVLFRDPVTHSIRAFDRRLPGDLVPRFAAFTDPKKPAVQWIDTDTASEWTLDGVAVAGAKDTIGKRLTPIVVDENLPLGILRFWYPDLHVLSVEDVLPAAPPESAAPLTPTGKPTARHKKPHRPPTP